MDIVTAKFRKFDQALQTFEEVAQMDLHDAIIRDSAIQRFEYTIDAFWKMLKVFLKERHEIAIFSPRETIKEACAQQILTDDESERILKMLNLRNETSHDYALKIAATITPLLPDFAILLRTVFIRIQSPK